MNCETFVREDGEGVTLTRESEKVSENVMSKRFEGWERAILAKSLSRSFQKEEAESI